MRLVRSQHDACDQAREHLSLALDDELAQLDRVRLDAHLGGCAGCRAFSDELSALTGMLRTSPLEQPSFDVILPRRISALVRLVPAAVAAMAAAVVLGQTVVNGVGNRQHPAALQAGHAIYGPGDDQVPVRDSHQRRAGRLSV